MGIVGSTLRVNQSQVLAAGGRSPERDRRRPCWSFTFSAPAVLREVLGLQSWDWRQQTMSGCKGTSVRCKFSDGKVALQPHHHSNVTCQHARKQALTRITLRSYADNPVH